MTQINIKYVNDELLETLKVNVQTVTNHLIENPNDSTWIHSLTSSSTYVEKKYKIDDFELELPSNETDTETIMKNAIKLYETLKGLPQYVLCDERFWLWIMFDKAYDVALKTMPIKKKDSSVFKDHWLFSQGRKRGLWFGVLSRDFFRVKYSVDEDAEDKYEYTRFCFELFERIRVYMWRGYGSNKDIVLGALKGEKKAIIENDGIEPKYSEIAKDISKLGSLKILDCMSQKEIEEFVYTKCLKSINKRIFEDKKKSYDKALDLIDKGDIISLKKALSIFEELDDFDDSTEQLSYCKQRIIENNEKNSKKRFGFFKKSKQ